jgi:hypothetical protein
MVPCHLAHASPGFLLSENDPHVVLDAPNSVPAIRDLQVANLCGGVASPLGIKIVLAVHRGLEPLLRD